MPPSSEDGNQTFAKLRGKIKDARVPAMGFQAGSKAMLRKVPFCVVMLFFAAGCGDRAARESATDDRSGGADLPAASEPLAADVQPAQPAQSRSPSGSSSQNPAADAPTGEDPAAAANSGQHEEELAHGAALQPGLQIAADEVERLLSDMASDATLERRAAAELLDELGPAVIPWVVRGLQSGSTTQQRGAATYLIGRLGPRDEEAVAVVVSLLGSPDAAVRRASFQAVERLEATQLAPALPALLAMAADPEENQQYRSRAVLAIGKLPQVGGEDLEALMSLAAEDEDLNVRRAALFTIRRVAPPKQAETFFVQRLEQEPHADVRRLAAKWLGQVAVSESSVEALIQAFGDQDESVRESAVEALVDRGRPTLKALTQALESTDVQLRRLAVETLGKMGPLAVETLPALTERLTDQDEPTRLGAANAIRLIRGR